MNTGRTLEEAILLAVLNEDEAETERLVLEMLPGELYRFSEALEKTQKCVNRAYWVKKSQENPNARE